MNVGKIPLSPTHHRPLNQVDPDRTPEVSLWQPYSPVKQLALPTHAGWRAYAANLGYADYKEFAQSDCLEFRAFIANINSNVNAIKMQCARHLALQKLDLPAQLDVLFSRFIKVLDDVQLPDHGAMKLHGIAQMCTPEAAVPRIESALWELNGINLCTGGAVVRLHGAYRKLTEGGDIHGKVHSARNEVASAHILSELRKRFPTDAGWAGNELHYVHNVLRLINSWYQLPGLEVPTPEKFEALLPREFSNKLLPDLYDTLRHMNPLLVAERVCDDYVRDLGIYASTNGEPTAESICAASRDIEPVYGAGFPFAMAYIPTADAAEDYSRTDYGKLPEVRDVFIVACANYLHAEGLCPDPKNTEEEFATLSSNSRLVRNGALVYGVESNSNERSFFHIQAHVLAKAEPDPDAPLEALLQAVVQSRQIAASTGLSPEDLPVKWGDALRQASGRSTLTLPEELVSTAIEIGLLNNPECWGIFRSQDVSRYFATNPCAIERMDERSLARFGDDIAEAATCTLLSPLTQNDGAVKVLEGLMSIRPIGTNATKEALLTLRQRIFDNAVKGLFVDSGKQGCTVATSERTGLLAATAARLDCELYFRNADPADYFGLGIGRGQPFNRDVFAVTEPDLLKKIVHMIMGAWIEKNTPFDFKSGPWGFSVTNALSRVLNNSGLINKSKVTVATALLEWAANYIPSFSADGAVECFGSWITLGNAQRRYDHGSAAQKYPNEFWRAYDWMGIIYDTHQRRKSMEIGRR